MQALRFVARLAAVLVVFAAAPALAGTPFTQKAFTAAQDAGKPILVEIHASWCPTCRAQQPIINSLTSEPRFGGLTVFTVDYDGQKDVVRAFNARQQSTLIVFKGAAEVGRSVGDTNQNSIAALLAKAI